VTSYLSLRSVVMVILRYMYTRGNHTERITFPSTT
jgi:hypothetical protein